MRAFMQRDWLREPEVGLGLDPRRGSFGRYHHTTVAPRCASCAEPVDGDCDDFEVDVTFCRDCSENENDNDYVSHYYRDLGGGD